MVKYATRFYRGGRCLGKTDEIIIKYKHRTAEIFEFEKTLKKHQRLVLDVTELDEGNTTLDFLDIFSELYRVRKNMAILTTKEDTSLLEYYDAGLPFFFIEGADTPDELIGQVNLGVSDVYIINELGFSIAAISDYCKAKNVNIRVHPNIAQSSSAIESETITQFYIRPEDVDIYEEYIDIIEFYGPVDRQSVLYEIYKEGVWKGDLSDIIIGIDKQIPNTGLLPHFGYGRLNCGKICTFDKCDICKVAVDLAIEFDKNDMEVTIYGKDIKNALLNEPAESFETNE